MPFAHLCSDKEHCRQTQTPPDECPKECCLTDRQWPHRRRLQTPQSSTASEKSYRDSFAYDLSQGASVCAPIPFPSFLGDRPGIVAASRRACGRGEIDHTWLLATSSLSNLRHGSKYASYVQHAASASPGSILRPAWDYTGLDEGQKASTTQRRLTPRQAANLASRSARPMSCHPVRNAL
ncbi:hypothetical protein VFPFJ_08012 [Purpureocillium lilacinum]|uniref:Uncharacterized protein n=1 Tax=Purpureocillium lilacinum TaxID=33203 RepID=A0A179H7V1_PURLI|nr:hypothetical protein VFPFJ_08012 [Purpureocillium lilacinum]OAQ85623.1 hypothetical protein VFPFJ_08012 [Purpureocillium lilacinum]